MKLPTVSKALLVAKAAYFFFYFSYSSVTPYIAVFVTAYGLNAKQAGFVIGARFFTQFISGPLWGGLADKTRKYRFVLLLQIFTSTALKFTTPWTPKILPTVVIPCPDIPGPLNNSIMTTGMAFNFTKTTELPTFILTNYQDNRSVSNTESKKIERVQTTIPLTEAITRSFQPLKTNSARNHSRASQLRYTGGRTLLISTAAFNKTDGKSNQKCTSKNPDHVFILMTVWLGLIGAFDGGIPLLIDNSVLDTIGKVKTSDFGKQRLWGSIGFGLAAFASGVGVDLSGGNKPNYFTMFYIFLTSNVCLFICCCFLDMSGAGQTSNNDNRESLKKPHLIKGLIYSFKKFNVTFFFITVLMMGFANGLLFGFMFLYIQDLNGSRIVMGVSILVACMTEVLMFPISSKTIKLLHGNLAAVAVAFAAYAVRFAGFSFLHNAWFILIFQLLHSLSFALFWDAVENHTSDIAPPGMQATFLGIMNGLFFGFAGGVSSIVGGTVYNYFGGRNMFRGYAIICAVWTVFLILHILERRRSGKLGSWKEREKRKALEIQMEERTSQGLLSGGKD